MASKKIRKPTLQINKTNNLQEGDNVIKDLLKNISPPAAEATSKKVQKSSEYNLKYNPYIRNAVVYAPSYGNCKSGNRGGTRNMIQAEIKKLEAPITVYKHSNAATYASDAIKGLLENMSPRIAMPTSKEVQKSLGNKNKIKSLYFADNAAMMNLKRKLSEKERTDIPAKRGNTTVGGINQSMDITGSKKKMNNLEAQKSNETCWETNINVLPKVPSLKFGIPPKIDENEAKNIETPKTNFTFDVINQKETNSASTILADKENKENENPQEVPKIDSNAVPVASQAQNQTPAFASSMQNVVISEQTTTDSIQKTSSHTFVPSTIASSSVNVNDSSTSNITQNYKAKISPSKSILQQANVDQNSGIKDTPNMFNFTANTNNIGQAANPSFHISLPVTNISANVQINNNPVMFDIPVQRENVSPQIHPTNTITTRNEPSTTFNRNGSTNRLSDRIQLSKNTHLVNNLEADEYSLILEIDKCIALLTRNDKMEAEITNETSGETNVLPKVPSFVCGIPPKIDENEVKNNETPKSKENKDNENPQKVTKVDLTHVSNAVPVASQSQNQTPAASSMQNVVHKWNKSINLRKPKPSPSKSILQQSDVDQNSGIKKTPKMFNVTANTNNKGRTANSSFNIDLPVKNISANIQTNNNPVMFDIPVQRENASPQRHPRIVIDKTNTITTRNDMPTATFNRNGSNNRLLDRISFANNTQNKNPFENNVQYKNTGFTKPITRFPVPTESAASKGNTFILQQQSFGRQRTIGRTFNSDTRRSNRRFGFGENESNIRQPVQDNGMWGNYNRGQVAPANSLQFNMGNGTANNPPPKRFKRNWRRTQQR